MEQFLYKLKLKTIYLNNENWTEKEEEIINRHFLRLKKYTEEGKVILAGRTLNEDNSGFGIVIFEAESETSARQFMESDPAISEGMMDGILFPYRVALMRK
ncbi:YciI family protein [Bacillus sp. 31A1R]|uniref:YciI family protein n=1 Tax=Robertmurraya mangrovi TaxID=3098077 RepID=A0ABU5IZ87_9BACI|nr:YciI family protein [Bacillus sp. 31A1R]MDZ5472420.1 YciI family protein [Bacillus sp. 31A1R]